MTDDEKIALVKELAGDSTLTDAKVTVYLNLAKDTILHRLYQLFDEFPNNATLPSKYDMKQCTLAVAMLQSYASGFFGNISQHSESAGGTSVTDIFGNAGSVGASQWASQLADITPYARVTNRRC